MNSQDHFEFMAADQEKRRVDYERQANREAKTTAEGVSVEAITRQPGWKVITAALEVQRDRLLAVLKNPHIPQTKEQMKVLQIHIAAIELFLKTPMEYVDKLKQLTHRKMKKI